MFFGVLVAAQAAGASLLRCGVLKGENFGLVSSAVDVLFPGAMTSLAAMPLHAFVCVELPVHSGCEVGRSGEIRIDLFMAGLAGVGTHVEIGIRRRNICLCLIRGLGLLFGLVRRLGLVGRLGLLCGILLAARLGKRNQQRRNQHCQEI